MRPHSTFFFFFLIVLIAQGCAQRYTATPYHREPPPYQDRQQPYREPSQYQEKKQPELQNPVPQVSSLPENPLVQDINYRASQFVRKGQLDAAAQTLERGLRMVPKDALLWSQLAAVKLQQRHYGQAQSLAAKSISLAKGNSALIHKNEAIIAKAKKQEEL